MKGAETKSAARMGFRYEVSGKMARATNDQPATHNLTQQLANCETVTELFKLANSDGFKLAAYTLQPDELTALRAQYRARQAELDGKTKLEEYDGQIINIVGCDWWYSEMYGNSGVTLRFSPENSTHKLKALTSSAPIVRFCERFGDKDQMPSPEKPCRVQIKLNPVSDAERAARGQRIWSIRALPAARDASNSGSPF